MRYTNRRLPLPYLKTLKFRHRFHNNSVSKPLQILTKLNYMKLPENFGQMREGLISFKRPAIGFSLQEAI